MNRGDVILVRFPHPSGVRGKKRPAVVVQSVRMAAAVKSLSEPIPRAGAPNLFVQTTTAFLRAYR